MAFSTPNVLNASGTDSSATHTVSVTPSTGDLLIVTVSNHKFQPASLPTGVTWNGIAMTEVVSEWTNSAGSGKWSATSIWRLKIATGATANVVVTCPEAQERIYATISTTTGENTSAPTGDVDEQQADNGGTQPSLTLTTAVGDLVVYVVGSQDDPVVAGADLTSLGQDNSGWRSNHMYRVADATSENVTASTAFGDRGYSSCAAVFQVAGAGSSAIAAIAHHYRQQGIM